MEREVVTTDWETVSEVSLVYKTNAKFSQRPHVYCSENAYKIFLNHWDKENLEIQEEFKIMLLNQCNRLIGVCNISKGGVIATVADPKIIFAFALKSLAWNVVLCHNHPSGNLEPSEMDRVLTNKITEGTKYFNIRIADHLIISAENYFSFRDRGLM